MYTRRHSTDYDYLYEWRKESLSLRHFFLFDAESLRILLRFLIA